MGGTVSTKTPPSPTIYLDPSISNITPDWKTGKQTADPHYGFEGKQRKERVMIATEAEMKSAKVPLKFRDYCAHKYILFEKCRKDKWPFSYRCAPEKHDLGHCEYEDYIIRMKEFERERRLLHRKARKEAKANKKHAHADAFDE